MILHASCHTKMSESKTYCWSCWLIIIGENVLRNIDTLWHLWRNIGERFFFFRAARVTHLHLVKNADFAWLELTFLGKWGMCALYRLNWPLCQEHLKYFWLFQIDIFFKERGRSLIFLGWKFFDYSSKLRSSLKEINFSFLWDRKAVMQHTEQKQKILDNLEWVQSYVQFFDSATDHE